MSIKLIKNHKNLIKEIKKVADVNLRDKKGETLLHYAVAHNEIENVKILLEAGARADIKNDLGFTALQLGQFLYRKECLALFKQNLSVLKEKNLPPFEHINHLIFKNERFFRRVIKRIRSYPSHTKVAIERRWLGALYRPYIESGYMTEVRVEFIHQEIGCGLIANRFLRKGDYIGEYTGEVKRFL